MPDNIAFATQNTHMPISLIKRYIIKVIDTYDQLQTC